MYMKNYFIALIALFLVLFSYDSLAQRLTPIPMRIPVFVSSPTSDQPNLNIQNISRPGTISATVKGALYVRPEDKNAKFKIVVYKLVNNRWVNVDNFSTEIKPDGSYLTVIRGEGTYRFVPTVKFDPKFKYTFSPLNHTVRIQKDSKNNVFIRNFSYKKTNRK